jgi:uncharacterized MAPEG superfamily protein
MTSALARPATAPTLRRARALIGLQIALSVPLQIAAVRAGSRWAGWPLPASDAAADRLAYASRWLLLGGGVFLVMVGFLAGARPLWAETIGGDPDAARLDRHVRVQRNTLEQLVAMALAHAALATTLPFDELRLLPTLAVVFVASRLVYWVGYVRNPLHRTLGFVATFYPNLYATGLALWLAFGPR